MPYTRPDDSLVLEGIITTLSSEGHVNIAPMGPIVDPHTQFMVLRPFKTSTTYKNLKATGEGVFHITDDVLLMARAAIGEVQPSEHVPVRNAERVTGLILADACRYYELQVASLDDLEHRVTIEVRVVAAGRLRDFIGFNRARHAVLEAAILATRVHLSSPDLILDQMKDLQVLVDKTGNQNEHQAMHELREYVNQ